MSMTNTTRKSRTRPQNRMRKLARELCLYVMVSAIALAVDFALLLQLARHVHYLVAATLAFLAGCGVHYLLSVRYVFKSRRFLGQPHAERVLYVGAGIAGLLVNWLIIAACVELFALPLATAKIAASGISFFVGYLIRKLYLFTSPAGEIPQPK